MGRWFHDARVRVRYLLGSSGVRRFPAPVTRFTGLIGSVRPRRWLMRPTRRRVHPGFAAPNAGTADGRSSAPSPAAGARSRAHHRAAVRAGNEHHEQGNHARRSSCTRRAVSRVPIINDRVENVLAGERPVQPLSRYRSLVLEYIQGFSTSLPPGLPRDSSPSASCDDVLERKILNSLTGSASAGAMFDCTTVRSQADIARNTGGSWPQSARGTRRRRRLRLVPRPHRPRRFL
jgi:hypothetical protein